MQNKLKVLVAAILPVLYSLPFSSLTAKADVFAEREPTFGMYCENENAIGGGKIRYAIDENKNAAQYCEYYIEQNASELYIPFISDATSIPEINLHINKKPVTAEICYGTKALSDEKYEIYADKFYPSEIDENLMGILYTFTADTESFEISFNETDKRNYIYKLTNAIKTFTENGKYCIKAENARPNSRYEIFSVNGEFTDFESTANTVTETISAMEYVARNFDKNKEFYAECGITRPDFFYSLMNYTLKNPSRQKYSEFFNDSIYIKRLNAFKLRTDETEPPYEVIFSVPVNVRKNTSFKHTVYMAEHISAGNYKTDYTINFGGSLQYIIESNAQTLKKSDNEYCANNVSNDFYFIFCDSENSESIYPADNGAHVKIIVLSVSAAAYLIAVAVSVIAVILYKKEEN